jgi:hypothetical protein
LHGQISIAFRIIYEFRAPVARKSLFCRISGDRPGRSTGIMPPALSGLARRGNTRTVGGDLKNCFEFSRIVLFLR